MIGQTISHYRILEKLGEGGMGVVYKAEDTKLKRIVALKFLSSQSLGTQDEQTRFIHEAQAAAALDHPNICAVHEIDEVDGQTFIVMAYIDGVSLRERIDSGPLKLDEALSVALDVAEGLQEAHEKGIVHRDIKSGNVMVTEKGRAKITDFGLAKLAGHTKVTKTGTTVGTAAYMSPEQSRGDGVDHRSDIWSLGVVLYEMLTGRLPFRGRREAVTYQILHEDPEPITAIRTGVPMELERITGKCLEKNASDRYQHVDDVLVDLRRVKKAVRRLDKRSDSGAVASRDELKLGVASRSVRWSRVGPGGAVVVVLGLVAAWWFFLRTPPPDPNTILVVPFEVRGPNETDPAFVGRAFAEAIAVGLSEVSELAVLNVPKSAEESVYRDVAGHAGAGRIILGTLSRDEGKTMCNFKILKTPTDQIVSGASLEKVDADLSDMSSELSRDIATKLGFRVRSAYGLWNEVPADPAVVSSPDLLVVLKALRERRADEGLAASGRLAGLYPESFYVQLLRLEVVASLQVQTTMNATSWREGVTRQAAVLDRLDAHNPYGALYRTSLTFLAGDYQSAIQSYNQIFERTDLSPGLRAQVLVDRGRCKSLAGDETAIDDAEAALRMYPADAVGRSNYSQMLMRLGRAEEAEQQAREAIALEGQNYFSWRDLGLALRLQGKYAEAAAACEKAHSLRNNQIVGALFATVLWLNGEHEKAMTIAAEADSLPHTGVGCYNTACFYAVAGSRARALEYLHRAVELGYRSTWIGRDPDLQPLHGDPEFEAILADIRPANSPE